MEPIYLELKFHLCGPEIRFPDRSGPTRTSQGIKRIVEIFDKFSVLGELAFVGPSAIQLQEDFPGIVEKIKRLKVPITYHGGAGHPEPGVAGRMKDAGTLPIDEAIVAEWEFEAHWLQPNWHWEGKKLVLENPDAGKPVPGKFGGFLAIEKVLGVVPMSMGGDWTEWSRLTPALKALGAGWYKPSLQEAREATQLLGLHESYIQVETGVPPKYFRKKPGVDAPMRAEPEEWLDRLATTLPRERPYYLYTMVHAGHSMQFFDRFERLVDFIHNRKDDFKFVWLDPEGVQWRPENSALEFFRKTYGLRNLEEALEIPCPVEKIKEMWKGEKRSLEKVYHRPRSYSRLTMKTAEHLEPSKRRLKRETVLMAANQLILNWPQEFSHDGDFPYPPDYVDLGTDSLSLTEAFQAFAYSLEYYLDRGSLPQEVEVEDLLGPIDYPMYDLEEEPKIDHRKLTGYNPREISEEKMPDSDIVNSQGLPAVGDYYVWMPVHAILDDEDVMQAAWESAKWIRRVGHILGIVEIPVRSEESRQINFRQTRLLLKYRARLNAAEFLYALAQEYRLTNIGKPGPVMAISMKIIKDQPCGLITPYSSVGYKGAMVGQYHRLEGFIWRARVSKTLLNKAWTYKPKG